MEKLNILLIGQYRIKYDGWTEATRSLIKSIQTIPSINLTIKNINMANKPSTPETEFKDLEKTQASYDTVLQKIIPDLFTYDSRFNQNIGMCVFETKLPRCHEYIYRINSLLNKVTVTNSLENKWLSQIVDIPVFTIGEAIDIHKYDNVAYPPINDLFAQKNLFKFLFAGENTERKNIVALLKAYLTEFEANENVCLVIKSGNNIEGLIEHIRKSLRKNFHGLYPMICVINQFLPEEQMAALYAQSHCFVVPSRGESFCRGAAESIAAGKPIITTDNIGTKDFVTEDTGWIVKSTETISYCEQPPMPELYSAIETWQEIDVLDLMSKMRQAFSNKELYNHKCDNLNNLNIKDKFSYTTVGKNIAEMLGI